MKGLITTLLTLSVGSAFAATATTTAPNAGTSATSLEQVAPKTSPIAFKYELYNEKAQKNIDANKDDMRIDHDIKATYKLSDNQSLRLRPQFRTDIVEAAGKTETVSRMGETYLQYGHTGLAQVGEQKLDLLVRTYVPTSVGEKKSGRTNQTRIYLSSDFKPNETVTITPYLNPRFYNGSGKYEDTDSNLEYLMITMLEVEVALSDRFAWTTDLARFDYGFNGGEETDAFYLETWLSATLATKTAATEKISLDFGFFNENTGEGFKLKKNSGELAYFTRLHVNF
jgi:hypothetical protein